MMALVHSKEYENHDTGKSSREQGKNSSYNEILGKRMVFKSFR